MKIHVSHGNAYWKISSAEEEFNNDQVDRMNSFVDSQSLSKAFLSFSSKQINYLVLVAEMEIIHGVENMQFQSQA